MMELHRDLGDIWKSLQELHLNPNVTIIGKDKF